ncbi:hypothetical protein MN608_00687 [Microdochium nivale]|nr:hypothetical protein MN608_00687 [Microdochium nivale]
MTTEEKIADRMREEVCLRGMKGPGIIWVGAKIKKPDVLDQPTYIRWHDEVILPRTLAMSAFPSAVRTIPQDQSSEWTSVCILPTPDLASFESEEFHKAIGEVQASNILPDGSLFRDLIDFDCRFYKLQGTFEHVKHITLESTKCMMVSGWDLRDEGYEAEFEEWYYRRRHPMMTGVTGYLRSSCYKLDRGLWTSGDGSELPCSDWLEITEFDTPLVDVASLAAELKEYEDEMCEIMANLVFSSDVYEVRKSFGDKTLFHGVGRVSN